MRAIPFLFISALSFSAVVPSRADESRRFFDFTPISPGNPIVATIDGTIKIPLSELRAYRNTERLQATTDSLAEKRVLLEDLINEYLLVDETYRTGVVESPRFSKQMEATRTMILTDLMTTRAINEKSEAVANARDAAAAMADRLYDMAMINISNEAYDILKRAAKTVDKTRAASERGPVFDSRPDTAAKLYAIINATPEAVLVRYEDKSLSIHQVLSIYAGLPAPRPQVETQDGFVAMIKPLITPELMAMEATKQGIAAEPEFQNKLTQNRNALLRFQVQGAIDSRANEILRGPDLDAKLQAWYREHAHSYATSTTDSGKKIPSFSDVRDRILADFSVDLHDRLFAEKTRELRLKHTITIDETVLKTL
jgi:hypothetical protein